MSSTDRMEKLVHRVWNTLSPEQRVQFLLGCEFKDIVYTSKLLWFELDESEQKAIIKWFLKKLGLIA